MAFLVQDDAGSVVGANAYVSVAEFTSYHTDRNVTAVIDSDYELAAIQAAIILASDYLDSRYSYVGEKRTGNQPMSWPRFDAEDRDDHIIFGIPQVIKEACSELALANLQVPGSLFPVITQDATGQGVKRSRQKLDVLETEVEYFGDSAAAAQKPPVFYQADWRLQRSGLLLARNRLVRGG
jgi:hypothetical protein